MVTLTVSSFNASFAGVRKEIFYASNFAKWFVSIFYFLFHMSLALSPISCSEDSDLLVPIHKTHSQDTLGNSSYALVTVLSHRNYAIGLPRLSYGDQ